MLDHESCAQSLPDLIARGLYDGRITSHEQANLREHVESGCNEGLCPDIRNAINLMFGRHRVEMTPK